MTDRVALANAKSVDIHAHAVLAGSMGKAGAHGPEIGYTESGSPWFRIGDYRLDGVRYEGSPFMDTSVRLANMDAAGIDFQVLSPNPLTYFHHIGASEAVSFCRGHNDSLAEIVSGLIPCSGDTTGEALAVFVCGLALHHQDDQLRSVFSECCPAVFLAVFEADDGDTSPHQGQQHVLQSVDGFEAAEPVDGFHQQDRLGSKVACLRHIEEPTERTL